MSEHTTVTNLNDTVTLASILEDYHVHRKAQEQKEAPTIDAWDVAAELHKEGLLYHTFDEWAKSRGLILHATKAWRRPYEHTPPTITRTPIDEYVDELNKVFAPYIDDLGLSTLGLSEFKTQIIGAAVRILSPKP